MKEEPEDRPRSMQKVPSLSDLSDPENSLGKFYLAFTFTIIDRKFELTAMIERLRSEFELYDCTISKYI